MQEQQQRAATNRLLSLLNPPLPYYQPHTLLIGQNAEFLSLLRSQDKGIYLLGITQSIAKYVILTYNWLVQVTLTKRAEKSLRVVPKQVAAGFLLWKREVEEHGIETVRKIPGYHDEPLQGKLKGVVRSVRLGRGYRAFYRIVENKVKCVLVEEVNNHDYKEIERLFGL